MPALAVNTASYPVSWPLTWDADVSLSDVTDLFPACFSCSSQRAFLVCFSIFKVIAFDWSTDTDVTITVIFASWSPGNHNVVVTDDASGHVDLWSSGDWINSNKRNKNHQQKTSIIRGEEEGNEEEAWHTRQEVKSLKPRPLHTEVNSKLRHVLRHRRASRQPERWSHCYPGNGRWWGYGVNGVGFWC